MRSALDKLLAKIDPERTFTANERLADRALNTFCYPGVRVRDWSAFRDCVARFFRHADNVLLRLPRPLEVCPDMDFHRACLLLKKEFGKEGIKTSAQIAIHGVEGGLYRVLKAIALRLAAEYSANEIGARAMTHWNSLTAQEKLDLTGEYLAKYGHLLPADVTEGNAPYLRAFFPKFLSKHPELLRRLHEAGRYPP